MLDMITKTEGEDAPASRASMTITRADLADAIYSKVQGLARKDAREFVDAVLEEISDAMLRGENVKLHAFGSFVVRSKRERTGRNPRTGVAVPIEPRRVISFRASPQLKQKVTKGEKSDAWLKSV